MDGCPSARTWVAIRANARLVLELELQCTVLQSKIHFFSWEFLSFFLKFELECRRILHRSSSEIYLCSSEIGRLHKSSLSRTDLSGTIGKRGKNRCSKSHRRGCLVLWKPQTKQISDQSRYGNLDWVPVQLFIRNWSIATFSAYCAPISAVPLARGERIATQRAIVQVFTTSEGLNRVEFLIKGKFL